MALKKQNVEFAEFEDDSDNIEEVAESVVTHDLKTARIKGTWTMYWGAEVFEFEDGKRFRIPIDLFNYLKARSCIYDTL
jgi:hypothetical protein